MDFADEHYVKLFTRDTVTWRSWPWQARALLPQLLRAVDSAGFLDVGSTEVAAAVAIMVSMPRDVVSPGLDALLASGTVETVGGRLLLSNFVAAQESRMTDRRKSLDYRERRKASARADALSKIAEQQEQPVTGRHTPSPVVTLGHPPAQPSSAQPSSAQTSSAKKPRKETPPPDSRHGPLVSKLCEIYRSKRGAPYPFAPRHARLVQQLLAVKPAEHSPDVWPFVLAGAWNRALDARYPECSTLEDFEKQLPRHLGSGAPTHAPRARDEETTFTEGQVHIG